MLKTILVLGFAFASSANALTWTCLESGNDQVKTIQTCKTESDTHFGKMGCLILNMNCKYHGPVGDTSGSVACEGSSPNCVDATNPGDPVAKPCSAGYTLQETGLMVAVSSVFFKEKFIDGTVCKQDEMFSRGTSPSHGTSKSNAVH